MPKYIKITKTQSITYLTEDQDGDYYADKDVVNIHMAALVDLEGLKERDYDLDDMDGDVSDAEYVVVLVDEKGLNEEPIDVDNKTRDEYFPGENESTEEDHEDGYEKPVAGELNAGGEAYGRIV